MKDNALVLKRRKCALYRREGKAAADSYRFLLDGDLIAATVELSAGIDCRIEPAGYEQLSVGQLVQE